MRHSLYWDQFEERSKETICCIQNGNKVPVRRVAVFVTDKCNFRCSYCNSNFDKVSLSKEKFIEVVDKYGEDSIIHITGGEPSNVKWLYPYLVEHGNKYKIHLNTNAFIKPPYRHIKRLKVSLDSMYPDKWDSIVGVKGAFDIVCNNIKEAMLHTVTSITYTLTKQNYKECIDFARFVAAEFPKLYAVFFSVYKGKNPNLMFDSDTAFDFFENILPYLGKELSDESFNLINETIDEKKRLVQGVRFKQGLNDKCYLSMSERVITPYGEESFCSHLYRDGIMMKDFNKHAKCRYGCNQRLVSFNEHVGKSLKTEEER